MGSVKEQVSESWVAGERSHTVLPSARGPTMQCQTYTCYVFWTFGEGKHRETRACLLSFGRFLSDGVGTKDRRGGGSTGVKSVTARQIARPRLVRLVQVSQGVCMKMATVGRVKWMSHASTLGCECPGKCYLGLERWECEVETTKCEPPVSRERRLC